VDAIEQTIDASGADRDTRVPPRDARASGDETVDEYLRAAERDLQPVWPRLAERLRAARHDL
jgi:hypothetical protein